jgi:hypothetical protein
MTTRPRKKGKKKVFTGWITVKYLSDAMHWGQLAFDVKRLLTNIFPTKKFSTDKKVKVTIEEL